MRLCVGHVYWMLLITSVVSSALLFLIVASENIQNSKFIGPDRSETPAQGENVSFIRYSKDPLETKSQQKSNVKIPSPLKRKIREQSLDESATPVSNFDLSNKREDAKLSDEIEILKESLNQQPNLSQGISENGHQAVVLTLVDSALGFRSAPSHESASNGSEAAAEEELARLTELIGEGNASAANHSGTEQGDVVVVVRAEQRSIADLLARPHDELEEEEELVVSAEQLAKSPTTAPELNDSAARARLTNGADDGNAAILDSLVTAGPTEPHEEIPSFNEWAQKRLEEAEKKKTHSNASLQTGNGLAGRSVGNMRMRSKNYASPDCGAKIVAANPESRSARNVLVSTRDEYMLNTCTSRVWFVVEMCEAIQAKKIELANFELFSSSPKDLSVYVSDRFPTRDWQLVGQFTARDERDVQSFSLQPQLFGKFIKVELHSHYGSEHFCPISLFRAYGTSEFEVLETETESDAHADAQRQERGSGDGVAAGIDIESEDDEDDENVFEDEEESTIEPPSHIISSARDAVLSIMKKAVGSLLKSDDLQPTNNITKIQESIRGDVLEDATLDDCTTPLYSVACRKCNDNRYARVFQLISCKGHYLESLLSTDFVMETLTKSHLCGSSSGLDVINSQTFTDGILDKRNSEISHYYLQAQFLSAMFTPDYIMALCNVLAAQEQRLFVNESHQEQRQQETAEPNKTEQSSQAPLLATKDERLTPTRTASELSSSAESTKVKADVPVIKSKADGSTETLTHTENLVVQIKPTKTTRMIEEAKKQTPVINLESSRSIRSEDTTTHQTGNPSTTETSLPVTTKRTTSSSQKVASEFIQEGSVHRDVSATTKITPTTESSQKLGEKNVSPEIKETETKVDDESEANVKVEPVEQEPKAQTQQDQLNFEGFDFKELDVENLQGNGNSRTDASVTQQTASATTPQQKESVFLRLSNRIKALERNMSLSSQYLEELSRRYKKQVEEMQRSLERAMVAMNEELRKGEEREIKQQEDMNALHSQIDSLTRILDELIFERNSWSISFSSLLQHSIFITFDVVIVILILSYCRRTDDDLEYYDEEDEIDERNVTAKPKRGKSYEIVKQSCTQFAKKPKKRRPSEIASQVSGTYDQLMIEDGSLMIRRDRRKKRKKDLSSIRRSLSIKDTSSRESNNLLNVPLRESTRHLRSASASDAMYTYDNDNSNGFANLESQRQDRPDSAPDNSLTYSTNQHIQQQLPQIDRRVEILSMEVSNFNDESTKTDEEMPNSPEDLNTSSALEDDAFEQEDSSPSSIRAKVKKLSSPSFMKTALGSRSKRLSFSGGSSSSSKKHLSLDESSVKSSGRRFDSKMDSVSESELFNAAGYDSNNSQAANGHGEETDESRSSNATPTASWSKKEKKSNGLKKMKRHPTN